MVQAHVAEADRAAELAKCDLLDRNGSRIPRTCRALLAVFMLRRKASLTKFPTRSMTTTARSVLTIRFPAISSAVPLPLPTNSTPSLAASPWALCRPARAIPSLCGAPALGIVKIILEKKLPLSLSADHSRQRPSHCTPTRLSGKSRQSRRSKFLSSCWSARKFVFREKEGFSYDEVNAVFRAGADDLVDARKRLDALRAIRKSKNFEPLTVSFKRIRKILEKAAMPAGTRRRCSSELFENRSRTCDCTRPCSRPCRACE